MEPSEQEEGQEPPESTKFDFDSEKGYGVCNSILKLVEKLYVSYGLKGNERLYRDKFSQAYKILYRQNGGQDSLCYLTEILDSAQENFPHLWVNGEKYVFSDDVIQAGDTLFKEFTTLKK